MNMLMSINIMQLLYIGKEDGCVCKKNENKKIEISSYSLSR